ncbi:hypothetical protein TNIN_487371 [Trichonephila inaurata madagascariensis]|uniref:Uncharacterized protein n=1 Tax=Trichonephila inaurata madagascariensis TaxID=2747483 RepID=A0A8X6XSA6_9ARAC|nr:hypothetical protein TNIN_487371 [Trichonephila inaurata madagascariensis]
MDLNFDTLLDMEPRTPTRPSTPTPTKICSQLSATCQGSGPVLNICKRTTVYHRYAGSLWNLRPGQSLCEGAPQQTLRVHRSASSSGKCEFSSLSLSPCVIDGCPHHDIPASIPIINISGTQDNSNDNFIMKTEKSLTTKRKEKSDGLITPPSSKISKFNDIQPNFQIELANKFNVLSQETAENLTTDSASTTIPNTVNAPLPNENTLNAPTLNQTL